MRSGPGETVGLQCIYPDGQKRFIKGTPKAGAYCVLGRPSKKGPIVFAEGYATGASVHMATGMCVVVAFDCGNLLPVARKIRAAMPEAEFLFAADDDAWTDGNPGMTAANECAAELGGHVVAPVWIHSRPEKHTDFNDLHVDEGLDAVM
jgi:putative DNA primase/helicase